ncbi:MAG: hypothetical protein ACR2IF_07925 [Terriglobales bacterium]
MRLLAAILVVLCSCAFAQSPPVPENPALQQLRLCSEKRSAAACGVSKQELKQARRQFALGLKLQKQSKFSDAFDAFDEAARLVPRDLEYATVREVARQRTVYEHLQSGNTLLLQGKEQQATAEFRAALVLDPSNAFALQRLHDAAPPQVPHAMGGIRVVENPGELRLEPQPGVRDFHLRGDTRSVWESVATAFGVKARFDESVSARQLRFDIEGADFATATRVLGLMTKTFHTPLSPSEIFVAADNAQNRAQFERMALRTFYVSEVTTPQELTELVNVFRTLFEIRFVTPHPGSSTITVRAPRAMLNAATRFFEDFDLVRPQVMLEFQVYEVSQSMVRSFGLDMPLQWQSFTVGAAALQLLQQPDIQSLINQLISSGGINQANTSSISALLAQLQNQQQNPLLKGPFATFGGGKTLTGIPWPVTSVNFSYNQSQVASLEHLTLRASQGNAATMRIGTRFPILNATFAPIFNTAAIAQVIQNQSFIAPFPSFTYEDLGIIVKATPQVHGTREVRLDLSVEIKALGSQSFNGVPVISNRMYQGVITVKNEEAAVVAGMLESSEQNSLTGIPGIARIPLLGTATSNHGKQQTQTELLVMIIPHIAHAPPQGGALVPLGSE